MALLQWLSDKVFKDIEKDMERRMKESLSIVAKEARRLCPVDKSDLRNSIEEIYFYRARTPMGIVKATGNEKDGYAAHVDLGYQKPDGSRVAPQPFMRNSIKRTKRKLKRALGV